MLLKVIKNIFRPAQPETRDDNLSGYTRNNNRINLLVWTHSFSSNGAAEMMMFLLVHLVRDLGWSVAAADRGISQRDRDQLAALGVPVLKYVNPSDFDVGLASTTVSGLQMIETVGELLPCVLWVHEAHSVLWNSEDPISKWKMIFNQALTLIFQSEWQAKRIYGSFTSNLEDDRVVVIPNCLPSIVAGTAKPVEKSSVKRIVFLGRLCDLKRPADLIQAVSRINMENLECIFVGNSDYLDSLPSEASRLLRSDKRFKLLGEIPRSEAMQVLADADVLCHPSADESQPLVLMEARALGVPVVISNLQVYADSWRDGENCLIHACGDIDALKHCLLKVLDEGWKPKDTYDVQQEDLARKIFLEEFVQVLMRGVGRRSFFNDPQSRESR